MMTSNKYKDALAYLRNSVVVTDHKQKERVNQCTELLQELIDIRFDESGNLKAFATIIIDEGKMIEICKEAAENIKEQLVDRYEKMLDKACEELENLSYVKGIGQVGRNYKEWREQLEKQVEEC